MGIEVKTSMIILTFNKLDVTKACIESIRKYTEQGTYEIIVVDNNSTDGTREWLKNQKDIKVILNEENLGFPAGCNLGIRVAEKENDILLLNNDTVLTPRWLDNLKTALYSSYEVGAVGPISNCVANQQSIKFPYGEDMEAMIRFAEEINISNPRKWESKLLLIGYCMLIKRSAFIEVGEELDELYSPGNYEDCDLALRMIEKGYKLLVCRDTFIHHIGSATFRDNPDIYSHFGSNREKFNEKWGFDHGLVADVREDLLSLIKEDEEREFNVLEVGCGSGMNLMILKYKYPKCNIYGIENDEKVASITKKNVSLSTKKIDEFPLDFKENFFDYIILNDKLHYIDNPKEFISNISKHLKSEGHMILNIKNIMYVSNIKELLRGNFYTHQRSKNIKYKNLFSLQDIANIFSESGFTMTVGQGYAGYISYEDNMLLQKLKEITSEDLEIHYVSEHFVVDFKKVI
ncbi:glycosyltransferase [Clostridium sp.]|uniref:glycosyltransferase n=1 Tax=Clostridium sp. TaxID=1506 RepID=UPI003F3F1B71